MTDILIRRLREKDNDRAATLCKDIHDKIERSYDLWGKEDKVPHGGILVEHIMIAGGVSIELAIVMARQRNETKERFLAQCGEIWDALHAKLPRAFPIIEKK